MEMACMHEAIGVWFIFTSVSPIPSGHATEKKKSHVARYKAEFVVVLTGLFSSPQGLPLRFSNSMWPLLYVWVDSSPWMEGHVNRAGCFFLYFFYGIIRCFVWCDCWNVGISMCTDNYYKETSEASVSRVVKGGCMGHELWIHGNSEIIFLLFKKCHSYTHITTTAVNSFLQQHLLVRMYAWMIRLVF